MLKNKKGIESSPFLFILSAIILFLTAVIVFPIFGEWQSMVEREKAISEIGELREAIDSVHTLGDIGSIHQVSLNLPPNYEIKVNPTSLVLKKENATILSYPLNVELIYRGNKSLKGPGNYKVTVTYWIRNDSTNIGKDYLIEVLT